MILSIVITAVVAYFLGNLNGAVLISRAVAHEDVRTKGSGNAGLTNFTRNYGSAASVFVIAIDVGKAVAGCLLGALVFEPYGLRLEGMTLAGACVMLGHDFPALQGFRGGKGILSGWFIAWTIDWRIGLLIGVVFFVTYLITKYVSLGSVLASITFAVGFVVFQHDHVYVMAGGIFMGALCVFMHRANILRLIHGEERKTNLFGKGNKS